MMRYARESLGLSSVTLRSINAYLASHGWRKMEAYGDSGFVFGRENEDLELLVPAKVLSDYQRRIEDILETLSDAEERDPVAILRDVSMSEYDLN